MYIHITKLYYKCTYMFRCICTIVVVVAHVIQKSCFGVSGALVGRLPTFINNTYFTIQQPTALYSFNNFNVL